MMRKFNELPYNIKGMKHMKFLNVKRLVVLGVVLSAFATTVSAQMVFRNAVTGEELDLDEGKQEGRDTPAVKEFLQTGVNPYTEDESILQTGRSLYDTACSACHGYHGEGRIGPALNRANWDYEVESDRGLFEVIFGGATRQMGPMNEMLTIDEILLVMAWIRHMYTGDPETASWLTPEQRENFEPYEYDE